MKKVLLFLIFPIISFSQINLCDRSVELSNYFYNSNYNDFVFGLSELKDEVYDYKHLNEIIDFNIARGLFFQGKYHEVNIILSELLDNQSEDFADSFLCEKSVFFDDYEVENVFHGFSSYWLKIKIYRLLSDSNYLSGNYSEALINLENSIKIKNLKKPFYTSGNALVVDVLQFEHRKFDILNELKNFEEANKSGLLILFLTKNEKLLNQLKVNLLQKYTNKEVKNELKSGLKSVKKHIVYVAGMEIEISCATFFDYKIILWNFKDDKDYIKRIKNSLGYKILSR